LTEGKRKVYRDSEQYGAESYKSIKSSWGENKRNNQRKQTASLPARVPKKGIRGGEGVVGKKGKGERGKSDALQAE